MNEKPVGTGPYRVTEHALGKYDPPRAQPGLLQGQPERRSPRSRRSRSASFRTAQTQVAEILSGGLDLIRHVPKDQADQLKAMPHLQVVSRRDHALRLLAVRTSQENTPCAALKDVRVRQAIMPCDRPRAHGEDDRRRRLARHPHHLLPFAVRLHRRGRRALRLRPGRRPSSCWRRPAFRTVSISTFYRLPRAPPDRGDDRLPAARSASGPTCIFLQYAAMRDAMRADKARADAPDLGLVLGQRRLGRDARSIFKLRA